MLREFFFRLIRPAHWLRNYPTSLAWDAFVLRAISEGNVFRVDKYTACVGGKTVWVGDYPFSYGAPYPGEVMPRASTVVLLAQALALAPTKDTAPLRRVSGGPK